MKVYDYIIVLRRPGYLLVDLISRFMLMIAIAILGYTVFWIPFGWFSMFLIVLIAGIAGWWIRCTIQANKGGIPYYRLGLLLATIGLGSLFQLHWIPILYFLAVVSEKQVKFPQEIAFHDEGIVINSLPKKRYSWQEIGNVVLKDGILTIDLKNNKLIQKEIESSSSAKEEAEFNEFCRARMLA
ncbi:MAG: hypothetical protein U9R46_01650 [Bacteroidota bacterium]|nr:hypothetical protein [Bacteroidota bacterium]